MSFKSGFAHSSRQSPALRFGRWLFARLSETPYPQASLCVGPGRAQALSDWEMNMVLSKIELRNMGRDPAARI